MGDITAREFTMLEKTLDGLKSHLDRISEKLEKIPCALHEQMLTNVMSWLEEWRKDKEKFARIQEMNREGVERNRQAGEKLLESVQVLQARIKTWEDNAKTEKGGGIKQYLPYIVAGLGSGALGGNVGKVGALINSILAAGGK